MDSGTTRSTFLDHTGAESSFSDRVAQLLARIDCRRADTGEQREAIFRLRYQAYMREGAISPNSSGVFSDHYDETENAYLFGVYIDGALASSVRLHVASREHPDFTSLEVSYDLLEPKVDKDEVLVDSTHLVADEGLSRIHRELPYATLRLCVLAAEHFRVDQLLAPVRAEHQGFYRRAFNYRLINEPRSYPHLAKPLGVMMVHYPTAAEQLYRRYPFFRSTVFERRKLFERGR
jgi:hypothetical protein